MITLQHTIKYQGDISQSPLSKIRLAVLFPVFTYIRSNIPGLEPNDPKFDINRTIVSTDRLEVDHELSHETYSIAAPTSNLIGGNDVEAHRNFIYFTFKGVATRNISDRSLTIPAQIVAGSTVVGASTLQAVYILKHASKLYEAMHAVYTYVASEPPWAALLESSLFLINKDTYLQILPGFRSITNQNDDWSLLSIISKFIEETDIDPTAFTELNDASRVVLDRILLEEHIERRDEVVQFIGSVFKDLFDFPILISTIEPLKIAGTFEVKTPDSTPITKDDLLFYNMTFEYSYRDTDNLVMAKIVHYDWSGNTNPVNENTIPFALSGTPPIVVSSVSGPITISVRAFDGTSLWVKNYESDDPALKEVMIVVSQLRPTTLKPSGPNKATDNGKKLRGQVLELTKKCALKDLTVVIQAKTEKDELWRVVAAASADASGNFSMSYPYGEYVKAQAIVSLTPDRPADIPIKGLGNTNETISDDFLYLLITNPECTELSKEEDCDCNVPKKAPRLPDQTDLIHSDDYTQDIGGSCLNLSTPNRTLNEYSYFGIVRTSDPHVANYTLNKIKLNDDVKDYRFRFELKGNQKTIQRAAVDIDNPIRWQDAPDFSANLTIYQSVSVATGHVLHYKSIFKADGYSLGDLLYSLGLAPGQKKQIVVMDSAHSLTGAESQDIGQRERLAAGLLNERDIANQIGGNINEAMRGRSAANTSGVSAGLGAAGSYGGVIGGALGVAGGSASTDASASQNSSRDTSMFFGEKLRQAITQNAESYRQLNASVVTAVQEGQQYAVTTDVVANHNHCHALTMMYFEVLRHYAIFQEMVNVEECIFVPLLMTHFSTENIYKWSDVLARNLLPISSNTYLQPFSWVSQHPLLKAFDANERIKTDYANVDFPAGRYCDDSITAISGTITIRIKIPRPKTRFDRILSLKVIRKTVTSQGGVDAQGTLEENTKSAALAVATGGLSLFFGKGGPSVKYTVRQTEVITRGEIFDLFMSLDQNFESVPPSQCIRVHSFDRQDIQVNGENKTIDFFHGIKSDEEVWDTYAHVLGMKDAYELLPFFKDNVIGDWDQIFYDTLAPKLVAALISEKTIAIKPLANLDITNRSNYSTTEQLLNYRFTASTTEKRAAINNLSIEYQHNSVLSARDKTILDQQIKLDIEDLTVNYTTAHYSGRIYSGFVGHDLLDNAKVPTPLNSDEQRNPRKEDIYIVTKLIEHLNSNLEHYNKTLWHNLDPDRRYMLLDGFDIQIYNNFGIPAGTRSLASVVKNELLTITGNSLVFPVAAGYKVSKSYISEKNQDGDTERVSLFDHYKPYTPIPPYRISVPSKGVFLEAVQGQCDACEKVKENSSQDWTKFTTDEPTPVLPVQTPVPTITDWKAVFKDFAPPLVNIQNAPALPAPGAGLVGLPELLGKAGIFKDITGLDATQQNVIRTYLSNQENAKAFAEMAKSMAMQEHNTKNSDRIQDAIRQAGDSGVFSKEDVAGATKAHVNQLIDGGEAQKRADEQANRDKPTAATVVAKELAKSVARGEAVSGTATDGNGSAVSVDQKPSGHKAPKYDFVVPGTLTPIQQPSSNACWATVTTMMSNWKKQSSQTVEDYIKGIGAEYVPFIQTGITISKLFDFCDSTGLKAAHTNTEYPVSFYYDVLQKNGPIWVIDLESDNPKMLHGRLLIGIRGDDSSATTMFTIIDPATGSKYDEDLPTFVSKTENVVKTLDAIKDVQIPLLVYYKDSYDKSAFSNTSNGGASIGAGVDNQTRVRGFTPANSDTLIVDGHEESAVPNLTNWRGLYQKADGSFSETKRNADRNFNYPSPPATPVGTKYCAGPYRGTTAINKVVLHETAGFSNFTSVSQFTVLPFPNNENPTSWYKAMPHFCINKDGTIIQFLDVCEHVEHGEGLSSSGIGIEFVNHPWGDHGESQDGAVKGGITPLQIPAITGYPSLNKRHVKTCLYIPAQAQLESLVNLLNALFAVSSLSSIKQNWLNVININPSKLATEQLDDLKAYFILNNASVYLKNSRYVGINGNISSGGWSINAAGVFDHALYGTHADGMILSFYTWLRIGQKMNQEDAMTTLRRVIADNDLRQTGGNNVTLVDVSKIVFGTA